MCDWIDLKVMRLDPGWKLELLLGPLGEVGRTFTLGQRSGLSMLVSEHLRAEYLLCTWSRT